jgi:hypothetical protein
MMQAKSGLNKFILFTPLKPHLADLLRNKPHHKDDNGSGKQKSAHVGKASPGKKSIKIISQSGKKY